MIPGSAGTAADRYKVEPPTGKHRAPPTIPTPKALPLLAIAAAVLTVASLTAIAGTAVAPDARAAGVRGTEVATSARASREVAGPLVLPSIGAEGAWTPSEETTSAHTENALRAPRSVSRVPVHAPTTSDAATGQPEPFTTPSVQTVTPTTPAVTPTAAATTTTTPTTPLAEQTAAADTTSSSSATPTQETTPVTETVTVDKTTVDVTAESPAPTTEVAAP